MKNKFIKNLIITIKSFIGFLLFNKSKKENQIFLYHEISYEPSIFAEENNLNINPKTFEHQIKWIKKRYNIIDPLDLLKSEKIERKNNRQKALITFDDGSISVLKNAAPILRKLGLKALFFLNMKPVEGGQFWAGKIQYLLKNDNKFNLLMQKKYSHKENIFLYINEEDLKSVSKEILAELSNKKLRKYYGNFANINQLNDNSDVFIYGSHLYDHYNASNLSEYELKIQIEKNKNSLSKINGYYQFFSYPFGQPNTCFNESTNKILIESGVKKIFYSYGGSNLSLENIILNRISPGEFFYFGYMRYLVSITLVKNLKKVFVRNFINLSLLGKKSK